MKEEMSTKFDNLSLIKVQSEQKKKRFIEERDQLKEMKSKINEEVIIYLILFKLLNKKKCFQLKNVSYERELKEKKLHLHELFGLYSDYEKRFSQNEQQIYQMKTYIGSKTKDMNYHAIQKDCVALIEEVNSLISSK